MASSTSFSLSQTLGLGALFSLGGYMGNDILKTELRKYRDSSSDNKIKTVVKEWPKDVFENINVPVFASEALEPRYKSKLLDLTKKSHLLALVKPIWKEGDDWWTKVYETRFKNNHKTSDLDTIFYKVQKGYSETFDETALNYACDTAYQTDKTSFDNLTLLRNIGTYCVNTSSFIDISEPESTTYKSTDDFTNNAEYKFGVLTKDENKNKLVKTIDNTNNNNELWWKWSYRRLSESNIDNFSDIFKSVEAGYSETKETPIKALNKACDEAYKKNMDELQDNGGEIASDIKKFCASTRKFNLVIPRVEPIVNNEPTSPVTFKTSDINSTTYNNNSILSITKRDNLQYIVKPFHFNKQWWRWSHQKKFLLRVKDKSKDLHELFRPVTRGYDDSDSKALNKVCDSAYRKLKTDYKFDDADKLLDNIGLFCAVTSNGKNIKEPYAKTHDTLGKGEYRWGVLSVDKNHNSFVQSSSTSTDHNDKWWEWAYKNKFDSKYKDIDPLFKKVTKGYDSNKRSEIALNQACEAAYKKNFNELKKDKKKLFENIKKFCTVNTDDLSWKEPEKPKTINLLKDNPKEKTDYNSGVAIEVGNKGRLLDPEDPLNKDIWDWHFEYYYNARNKSFLLEDGFKNLKVGYSTENNVLSLNKACKIAYTKKDGLRSDAYDKLVENVKEFCTLNQTTLSH